ncbi:XdhC family protein [Nocardia arizonensis]|uniref:XdhC family protein n=1 Tax=Nocardia arizonensis TaxID=1141647 RepID=UPI0006D2012D|nr:XdhC/CoxI family protein [Nocardia arizonensis]
MRAILDQLIDLLADGPVALARVVDATGAGPREPGAAMVVTGADAVAGSISGGCVDSAVVESARGVLATGRTSLERFGYTAGADFDDFEIGLPCGGELEIFVERVGTARLPILRALRRAIDAGEPIALAATLTDYGDWTLLRPDAREPWHGVDRDAAARLRTGRSGLVGGPDRAARPRTFVHVFAAPPRMILAGADDFVRALSRTGRQLGYRVTVVDARETFATAARFPAAHEVIVDWPHRYLTSEIAARRLGAGTVVCVMTHDAKFDVPALAVALGADLAFVGALGSRRTHVERLGRLRAAGVDDAALRRLRSPLGLDLNARTPEETAISIAAQILAVRDGGSARPLDGLDGPIHR